MGLRWPLSNSQPISLTVTALDCYAPRSECKDPNAEVSVISGILAIQPRNIAMQEKRSGSFHRSLRRHHCYS